MTHEQMKAAVALSLLRVPDRPESKGPEQPRPVYNPPRR
jgi:hypothetical protein